MLGFLGFKLKHDYPDMAGWSNGKTLFWIAAADAKGKKHKYRKGDIGFHHYAFELSSRKDVDALGAFLVEHGMTVVDPPGEYYEPSYYAVYFTDPDGMKLEGMVFKPPPKKRRSKKEDQARVARRCRGARSLPVSCPGRVQRAPLARAEREPGSSARSAKRHPVMSPLGPGSSLADARSPGTREGARTTRANSRLDEPLAVAVFTMSNSAVFFVPAARCCARVCPCPFASTPNEGWAERRQAHLFCCRACEARPIRASEARRVP